MKVSNRINNIQKVYQDQVKKAKTNKSSGEFGKLMQDASVKGAEQTKPTQSAGSVNTTSLISNEQKPVPVSFEASVNAAAKSVANEPDVRAEKVAQIKKLFDAGQYNISPEVVASRLLASGAMKSWDA